MYRSSENNYAAYPQFNQGQEPEENSFDNSSIDDDDDSCYFDENKPVDPSSLFEGRQGINQSSLLNTKMGVSRLE